MNNDPNLPKADPPLSPLGVTQAELLVEELRRLNFKSKILLSPFCRTLMTAQAMAKLLNLSVYLCESLREVVKVKDSLKNFRGLTLEEIKALFPETANDATLSYPWWKNEVEASENMDERVSPVVDYASAAEEDILLIRYAASVVAVFRCLMKKTNLRFGDPLPR